MSISAATLAPANMVLGPCQVTYNSVDLGGTLGNVLIHFGYKKAHLVADQTGPDTKLDSFIHSVDCTITTELAEVKDIGGHIAKVFPNATLKTTMTKKALQFENVVGTRMSGSFSTLTLHPLRNGTSDLSEDWNFYNSVPSEESEYVFEPAGQSKVKIIWQVYLDTTTTPYRLFRWGDTGA